MLFLDGSANISWTNPGQTFWSEILNSKFDFETYSSHKANFLTIIEFQKLIADLCSLCICPHVSTIIVLKK